MPNLLGVPTGKATIARFVTKEARAAGRGVVRVASLASVLALLRDMGADPIRVSRRLPQVVITVGLSRQ